MSLSSYHTPLFDYNIRLYNDLFKVPYKDQRNDEAPQAPCSLVQHPPESTTRQLTRTAQKPDAAGFGQAQQ
jgi:hypothetical protein